MDEAELQAMRQARMAELQAAGAGATGGQNDQQKLAEDEARASMLSQVLTHDARERISRIRIVRAEKARSVEDLILRMAQSGRLGRKVTEEDLVSLLDQLSQQEGQSSGPKIVFNRRDDDWDDMLSNTKASSVAQRRQDDDDDDDFFD